MRINREKHAVAGELEELRNTCRQLFDDAPVMHVTTSIHPHGPVIDNCNRLFCETLGYAREHVIGRALADFYSPESRRELLDGGGYDRALRGRFIAEERRLLKKDGGHVDTLLRAVPIAGPDGIVVGTRAMYVDITALKETQDALARAQEKHATFLRVIPDAIFHISRDGTYLEYIPAESFELYAPPGQFLGKTIREVMPEPIASMSMHAIERALTARSVERFEYELTVQSQRGFYEARVVPSPDDTVLALVRDVTTRRQLETQLAQVQKVEAIGQLAGGVAHDFNNLLTLISGHTDLSWEQVPEGHPVRENLEEIRQAARRATDLTRQLLAFGRRQILAPKVIDVNTIVGGTEKMLRRLIGEDIEVVTVLAPGLWRVKADPGQLEQVITNLAINARDAMPHGGRLALETQNVELDEAYARTHASVQPGPHVMLAVSDTGTGMDQETQRHLFEPFFTTKGSGQGTGLGLATVYGIVKQSGGNIWVYSEVGRGTTFKVYFPRVDEPLASPTPHKRSISQRGTETILLVEDEDQVRRLARRVLERNGYTVLEAAEGVQAIELAKDHAGPIHLLLTDVVMPHLSGRAVAEEVTSLRPSVKVLYLSGYTADASVHRGVLDPGTPFLEKPFTPDSLASKVREVLGLPE